MIKNGYFLLFFPVITLFLIAIIALTVNFTERFINPFTEHRQVLIDLPGGYLGVFYVVMMSLRTKKTLLL